MKIDTNLKDYWLIPEEEEELKIFDLTLLINLAYGVDIPFEYLSNDQKLLFMMNKKESDENLVDYIKKEYLNSKCEYTLKK